ncbi:MAG: MaoC family dehydratase [Pseudomonadota bacterium]
MSALNSSDLPGITTAELQDHVGSDLGVSNWVTIDQDLVDRFAAVSGDHQWIHVDPGRAAATPFGSTIAHGFLVLSLISQFRAEAVGNISDAVMGINYGFDRLRFTAPVTTGSRVRGRFTLAELDRLDARTVQMKWTVTVEIAGTDKPALVADWVTRAMLAADGTPQ